MPMLLYSGTNFDPDTFTHNDFNIEDIAHALSHNCRYNGHCAWLYPVGQHCHIIADILSNMKCNDETILYGLMHDASEAYLSDVPTPMKVKLPIYKEWETKIMDEILYAVGEDICEHNPKAWLKEVDFDLVHKVDSSMIIYEMRVLFKNRPNDMTFNNVMALPDFRIEKLNPYNIENTFNQYYHTLKDTLKLKYKVEHEV